MISSHSVSFVSLLHHVISQNYYFLTLLVKENSLLEVVSHHCRNFKKYKIYKGLDHWNSIPLLTLTFILGLCKCINV